MEKKKVLRLWIARDDSLIPDDLEHFIERHPEKEIEFGALHAFYDKPVLEYNPDWYDGKPRYEWKCAREMFEIPAYMYPEIGLKQCVEFFENIFDKDRDETESNSSNSDC